MSRKFVGMMSLLLEGSLLLQNGIFIMDSFHLSSCSELLVLYLSIHVLRWVKTCAKDHNNISSKKESYNILYDMYVMILNAIEESH